MKDLLVHSSPVQCTVTVSVHCNNGDFQDLIHFYMCYISKQRLLSSFRDSFVLISNQIRLFHALHPTVGHFQSFKLSSFILGFIQTIPVCMFFSLLSFQSDCVFLLWQKHKTLQPGNFHMSQVKASAVQQKGWLCSSSQKHEVSPCQPGSLQGRMKTALCFCLQSSSDLFRRLL